MLKFIWFHFWRISCQALGSRQSDATYCFFLIKIYFEKAYSVKLYIRFQLTHISYWNIYKNICTEKNSFFHNSWSFDKSFSFCCLAIKSSWIIKFCFQTFHKVNFILYLTLIDHILLLWQGCIFAQKRIFWPSPPSFRNDIFLFKYSENFPFFPVFPPLPPYICVFSINKPIFHIYI